MSRFSKVPFRASLLRPLGLLFAAFCLWQAIRPLPATPTNTAGDCVQIVQTERSGSFSSLSKKCPLQTTPIERLETGMRVLAENPELIGPHQPDSEVNPETWRRICLQLDKADGSCLDIELLRPREWIVEQAFLQVQPDGTNHLPIDKISTMPLALAGGDLLAGELLLGKSIHLDLPEFGATGPARVVSLRPCPPLEIARHAGRRLITGTFRHSAGNVVDLTIASQSGIDHVGTTDNHPFWSSDRDSFVPAGKLRSGEHLRQADGTLAQLIRITPRTGPPTPVFNLEIDAEHAYFVGKDGLLVHNSYASWMARIQFGQAVHARFANHMENLIKKAPAIDNTLLGRTGVDLQFAKTIRNLRDANGNLVAGFRNAELKPDTVYSITKFFDQLAAWRGKGLRGNVALFVYDSAGNITFHGIH